MSHLARPMYCSNNDDDDCTQHETRTRVGMPPMDWWGLEQLLYTHEGTTAISAGYTLWRRSGSAKMIIIWRMEISESIADSHLVGRENVHNIFVFESWLWIRIHFMRIRMRIQQFF